MRMASETPIGILTPSRVALTRSAMVTSYAEVDSAFRRRTFAYPLFGMSAEYATGT
jgi:hypothetical protein